MPENLKNGEVIATIPMEDVARIREITAEKSAAFHVVDHAMMKFRQAIIKENEFWDKMRKEYLIDPGTNFYIDFTTGQLRKG